MFLKQPMMDVRITQVLILFMLRAHHRMLSPVQLMKAEDFSPMQVMVVARHGVLEILVQPMSIS